LTISLFQFDPAGKELPGRLQAKRQTVRLDFLGTNGSSQPAGLSTDSAPVVSFLKESQKTGKQGLELVQR